VDAQLCCAVLDCRKRLPGCAAGAAHAGSAIAAGEYRFCRRVKREPELTVPAGRSEGNPPLPGNEIILREAFRLGLFLAARDGDNKFENLFAHVQNGLLSANNSAGVNINDVRHFLGQR